jgi:hypothetical protein
MEDKVDSYITGLLDSAEDLCAATDEFAKCKLRPGTPLYNLQQSMISHVKKYRETKVNTYINAFDTSTAAYIRMDKIK